jgi:hypothetical protein
MKIENEGAGGASGGAAAGATGSNLKYYCRNCGHEDNDLNVENLLVSTYEKKKNVNININPYIKFDPTLPHLHTIKCPNNKCKTNQPDQISDVIYFRYDHTNMKYIYLCAECDFSWKP